MNTLLQDLRYSIRSLAKSPGFFAAAVLSLAIGIGANTAVFSIVDALLLRPLPYKDAERLVILWNRSPGLNITEDWFSTAQYFDIKTSHRGLEQVAIAIGGNYNLTGYGDPERVGTIRVSSNLLPMLGLHAEQGRLFVADEDQPGRPATALLSYGTWTRRYGSDPNMLGKTITLNGVPYEVVGIMPRVLCKLLQRSVVQPEARHAGVESRPVTFDEILVRVRRVELDDAHALRSAGQVEGELLRDVGLSGAGWPVEDHLALLIEEADDVLEPIVRLEQERSRQRS